MISEGDFEKPLKLFDLLLALAFGFNQDEDIKTSEKLLSAAKSLLESNVINQVDQCSFNQAKNLFAS